MQRSEPAEVPTADDAPPLSIPEELWVSLGSEQQELYAHAQQVLDALDPERPTTLRALSSDTELVAEEILYALRALDSMELVDVGTNGRDVVVNLIAVPDGHVAITAPDGSRRWLFVARPLVAPEVDPDKLN